MNASSIDEKWHPSAIAVRLSAIFVIPLVSSKYIGADPHIVPYGGGKAKIIRRILKIRWLGNTGIMSPVFDKIYLNLGFKEYYKLFRNAQLAVILKRQSQSAAEAMEKNIQEI